MYFRFLFHKSLFSLPRSQYLLAVTPKVVKTFMNSGWDLMSSVSRSLGGICKCVHIMETTRSWFPSTCSCKIVPPLAAATPVLVCCTTFTLVNRIKESADVATLAETGFSYAKNVTTMQCQQLVPTKPSLPIVGASITSFHLFQVETTSLVY